jgi:hypothetical protein
MAILSRFSLVHPKEPSLLALQQCLAGALHVPFCKARSKATFIRPSCSVVLRCSQIF